MRSIYFMRNFFTYRLKEGLSRVPKNERKPKNNGRKRDERGDGIRAVEDEKGNKYDRDESNAEQHGI